MKVQAHRGAGNAPENSLSALRNAYFGTWDGVETDLQLLGDGSLVVHHDLLTGRVVDTGQSLPVRQMNAAVLHAGGAPLLGVHLPKP